MSLKKYNIESNIDILKKQKYLKLYSLKNELKKRKRILDPCNFGLADLLFPKNTVPSEIIKGVDGKYIKSKRVVLDYNETAREYRTRRYLYLRKFVEDKLIISKDAKLEKVKLIDPVLEFIGDIFFGYVRRAVIWKNRGGGGSFAVALVLWLRMCYHSQSFIDMAGCLLPDTEVLTSELKYIPVKLIKKGMHVWTLTKGWQKILRKVKRSGDYIAVEITPYQSNTSIFTSDHLIATIPGIIRDFNQNILNEDTQNLDVMKVCWKQANDLDKDSDLLIINKNSKINQDILINNENCILHGKERTYYSISKLEKFDYIGDVYDLEVDKESFFSCHNMVVHNSQEQAKQVYEYTVSFWNSFPELKKALVQGTLLQSLTKLKTGVELRCNPASQAQARSKHIAGLILDELCQEKDNIDSVFEAAMNAALTEDNCTIIGLSTFHIPIGFFQQLWDNATARGFRRYKWSIYETMCRCTEGLEFATKKDPLSLRFCYTSCMLTKKTTEIEYTKDGIKEKLTYKGCCGRARKASGFKKREVVIKAAMAGLNSDAFVTEWENERPELPGSIYKMQSIENAEKDFIQIIENDTYTSYIGIDWGYSEGSMVLVNQYSNKIVVEESHFTHQESTTQIANRLHEWGKLYSEEQEKGNYKNFFIFADSSHDFNNGDITEAGFDITAVEFNILKEIGISNLKKFFDHSRIEILSKFHKLILQLKRYKRDKRTNKPVKKEDHGPDALMVAIISIEFDDVFSCAKIVEKEIEDNEADESVLIF